MNRKEAIERLNKIIDYYHIEMVKNGHGDEIDNIMEVLKSHITFADFLGWEKDIEYEALDSKFMISDDNNLYELCNGEWDRCYTCSFSINTHKELQQAKKVEE